MINLFYNAIIMDKISFEMIYHMTTFTLRIKINLTLQSLEKKKNPVLSQNMW